MLSKSPIACLFLFIGLYLLVSAIIKGYPGISYSNSYGKITEEWPSVNLHAYEPGTIRRAEYGLWLRGAKSSWISYLFMVDDQWYHSGQFDVNGNNFEGSGSEVNKVLRMLKERELNKVYYNPVDPAESVIIPGIRHSLKSKFYIRRCFYGLFIIVIALFRIRNVVRLKN